MQADHILYNLFSSTISSCLLFILILTLCIYCLDDPTVMNSSRPSLPEGYDSLYLHKSDDQMREGFPSLLSPLPTPLSPLPSPLSPLFLSSSLPLFLSSIFSSLPLSPYIIIDTKGKPPAYYHEYLLLDPAQVLGFNLHYFDF